MEIRVRNVNEALSTGIKLIMDLSDIVSPRDMQTLELPGPLLTRYSKTMERVLFDPTRDANPFFHFFESLWMFQGRNDVWFPSLFVKHMQEYSDDGETLYGAYGNRWRNWFGWNQLNDVIDILTKDKDTRRVVLEIWASGDLRYAISGGKDVPCNTHVYFKIRKDMLNMSVCCRSNDMLWGAYGANAVHFSMLQEYIANKLKIHVGFMCQYSDSMHVYTVGDSGNLWERVCKLREHYEYNGDPYVLSVSPTPIQAWTVNWDDDLKFFVESVDNNNGKAT